MKRWQWVAGGILTVWLVWLTVTVLAVASYPTAVKSFPTRVNGQTIDASWFNDPQDEIVAIENGLLSGFAHVLKPLTTATYDLGSSTAKWRDGYFSRDVTIDGNLTVTGTGSSPPGMVAFFEAACPSGWTDKSSTYGGRYLVALPTGGTLSATVGSALTNVENRPAGSHNHAITDPGHFHSFTSYTQTNEFATNGGGAIPTTPSGPNTGSKTTGITINAGGGGTSGQTGTAGTNAPFVQLRLCKKD